MAPVSVGEQAPTFRLADTGGQGYDLQELVAGGPVLLFFFKLDCATSALAAPYLVPLQGGYGDATSADGTLLQVIAVSQDPAESSLEFGRAMGWTFPILLDEALEVSRAYDLESTPTLYLLRGADRLRADTGSIPAGESLRVVEVVTGWSRDLYARISDDIAARIGALPVDLSKGGRASS